MSAVPGRFSSELWPNGHYIHTIDGHREQKDGYHFWVLYRLSGPPDPDNKPTQRDVHNTGEVSSSYRL